jgi:hypothetical protein
MLSCKLLNYKQFKCAPTFTVRSIAIFTNLKNNEIISRKSKYRNYSNSNNGPWKILFFGNDTFSLQSLKALNTV